MSIRVCVLVVAVSVTGPLPFASGGELLPAMVRDFQEVNQWPCPYSCWDRESVVAPFPIMVQNGWRRQNIVADHHFVGNDGALSPAGQYKVRWILTQSQLDHRVIYVRRGETAEQTALRVEAIRQYAAKVAPEAGPFSILETHLSPAGSPAGWPGATKDDSAISRKFQPFVPDKIYLPDRKTESN